MRQVVLGKIYDTEHATEISFGCSPPGTSIRDHQYWEAWLYRTGNGRYFLSRKWLDKRWIQPLSIAGAMKFLEQHDQDALEEEFGGQLEEA